MSLLPTLVLAATVLSVANAVALSGDPASDPTRAASPLRIPEIRYPLHKGDSLEVAFAYSPELNQAVIIQPDGFVTLKEVGSLKLEGLTVPQAEAAIQGAYDVVLNAPSISVIVKEFEHPYFEVIGEVARPGRFDLRANLHSVEALAIAGGFTSEARHSTVILFHKTPDGGFVAKRLNLKGMLKSSDLTEDAIIEPGDLLYVPKNRISKVQRFFPSLPSTSIPF